MVLMANCPEVLATYNAIWRAGRPAGRALRHEYQRRRIVTGSRWTPKTSTLS
jgi:hypothetical protein